MLSIKLHCIICHFDLVTFSIATVGGDQKWCNAVHMMHTNIQPEIHNNTLPHACWFACTHTHIKINVMTNEFDFEIIRDSYRGVSLN